MGWRWWGTKTGKPEKLTTFFCSFRAKKWQRTKFHPLDEWSNWLNEPVILWMDRAASLGWGSKIFEARLLHGFKNAKFFFSTPHAQSKKKKRFLFDILIYAQILREQSFFGEEMHWKIKQTRRRLDIHFYKVSVCMMFLSVRLVPLVTQSEQNHQFKANRSV